jgi:hypothetical protein
MSNRRKNFTRRTKREARFRQHGRCACCNADLNELWEANVESRELEQGGSTEHAHHVVPAQADLPTWDTDVNVSSTDNCVIVCAECHANRCHGTVENDPAEGVDYRDGAVRDRSEFAFKDPRTDAYKDVEYLGGRSEVLETDAGRQLYCREFGVSPEDKDWQRKLHNSLEDAHSARPNVTRRRVSKVEQQIQSLERRAGAEEDGLRRRDKGMGARSKVTEAKKKDANTEGTSPNKKAGAPRTKSVSM